MTPALLRERRFNFLQTCLSAAVFLCFSAQASGQTPAPTRAQAASSLAESLKSADAGTTQLHFFYVHGMGIDPSKANTGTQNFQVSLEFRTRLCKQIGCTTPAGEFAGRNYAGEAHFAPAALPPDLSYLGVALWRSSPANDDWHAAAPFADHYRLVRRNGATIFVHEINWWPLVFSAKCRQIVAQEPALVGPDQSHIRTCSAPTVRDPDHDGRFKSYAWIDTNQVLKRVPPWPAPTLINREVKRDILDWGFADALLAVGPLRRYLIEGIRETVLGSVTPADKQEFVVVSHSLGSYLMFSALDLQSDPEAAAIPEWRDQFRKILGQTSHAYFLANQVRLLELANLNDSKNASLQQSLRNWADLRSQAQLSPPQIVAWSDPNDLLTYQVPQLAANGAAGANVKDVVIDNRPVRNVWWRWFGLLENPEKAHVNYVENKRVILEMLRKNSPSPKK